MPAPRNATAEPSERACGCTKSIIGHKGAEALEADSLADLHTSEEIATIAFKVIENYRISGKLGYGMLDSASNNDIIIAAL